jgi:hypothetical protein
VSHDNTPTEDEADMVGVSKHVEGDEGWPKDLWNSISPWRREVEKTHQRSSNRARQSRRQCGRVDSVMDCRRRREEVEEAA